MTRLIALDIPASPELRVAVLDAWNAGHAVLPLDQRMNPAIRRKLAIALGADELVSDRGHETLESVDGSLMPLQHDDALVIATSGSTGKPKGVVHTHRSATAHTLMVAERLGLEAGDHWWMCLPAAHIGGFGVLSRAMQLGSRISFANHVDERTLLLALQDGATHTSVVPTLLTRHTFTDWKYVLVGAARSDSLPANAVSTYGLTETFGGVVYNGASLPKVEVRLNNGRILLRSPTLARTYRHAPLPLVDGWLDSGDVGVIQTAGISPDARRREGDLEDQLLRVEGRSDDLIVTGGNKVWPHVVEQRLREHPLVDDVVVRGVPDAEWGTLVCAWIRPTSSRQPPTIDSLRAHIKETLPSYCAPRLVKVVDAIPRSALGKPLVSELP